MEIMYKKRSLIIDESSLNILNNGNWHWINSNVKGIREKWYLSGYYKHKRTYFHRELINAKKGEIADHKDGNTLNCLLSNMRIVTASQNAQNRIPSSDTKVKSKGVYLRKSGLFYSMVQTKEKVYYCGNHKTEQQASDAYHLKRKELGFIPYPPPRPLAKSATPQKTNYYSYIAV